MGKIIVFFRRLIISLGLVCLCFYLLGILTGIFLTKPKKNITTVLRKPILPSTKSIDINEQAKYWNIFKHDETGVSFRHPFSQIYRLDKSYSSKHTKEGTVENQYVFISSDMQFSRLQIFFTYLLNETLGNMNLGKNEKIPEKIQDSYIDDIGIIGTKKYIQIDNVQISKDNNSVKFVTRNGKYVGIIRVNMEGNFDLEKKILNEIVDSLSLFDLESKETKVYSNKYISFNYPSYWKIINQSKTDPLIFYFSACNSSVGSLSYSIVDKDKSHTLGVKNQYGSSEQTSQIISINGAPAGLVVQPEGDGSGGFQPSAHVDFLSKSQEMHFYLSVYKGCRKDVNDALKKDLLPIISTIKILE